MIMPVQSPRFGRMPDACRRSGLSKGKLYDLAAHNPGLFKKVDAATIVDLVRLDEIIEAQPDAELTGRGRPRKTAEHATNT
jgi:hypothetical protein